MSSIALLASLALLVAGLPLLPWMPRPHAAAAATGDGVDLAPVRLVHSSGAELSWARYMGPSGAPFDRYEVHRSTVAGFTPTAATLLTTIRDRDTVSYTDRTAASGTDYHYRVVANTTSSNEVSTRTPASGTATLTLQPSGGLGHATYVSHDTVAPTPCADGANHGAEATLRVGPEPGGAVSRSLLWFDLRDVPTGATVSKASLTLTAAAAANPLTVELHRGTRPWVEGSGTGGCDGSGATWVEAQNGISWAPGSDRAAASETSFTAKPGANTVDLLDTVRTWVDAKAPNDGLLLQAPDETVTASSSYVDFSSDDAGAASERPALQVTFADGSRSRGPRAAVASPGPGEHVTGDTPFEAAVGDDGAVAKVEFLVDGAVVASATKPPFSTTLSAANGQHTLAVRATDDVGNVTTSPNRTVTVDKSSAPAGAVSAPAAGATVAGTVTLSATASDDEGVSRVEFLVDGDGVGTVDTTAPYSTSWNTLDQLAQLWDGTHTVQARITDTSGNQTLTAGRTVTVDNQPGSQFDATFVLNDPTTTADDVFPAVVTETPASGGTVQDPYAGSTDSGGYSTGSSGSSINSSPMLATSSTSTSMSRTTGSGTASPSLLDASGGGGSVTACPTGAYCPSVTITNNSTKSWKGGDLSVWYRWYSPNGAVLYQGPAVDKFPQTFQRGATKTFPLTITPPTLPPGAELGDYRLRIDLYDTGNGTWFAARGNRPVDNPVLVVKSLDDKLGLERYWQYDGEAVGAGMSSLTNVANGNMLLRWTPWAVPGRGLSGVLDLTYNSLEDHSRSPVGENFSLNISGLSRFGQPLDIHPNKADQISGHADKYVDLVDGDGTIHRFSGNADGTWTEPAGVNLYLRSVPGSDAARAWALTRPDDVTFYYDADGFPTGVEDRNGNDLTFGLEQTPSGEDPGGPKKRVTSVTDAGGAVYRIDYWSKAEVRRAHVRGKIQAITDPGGHTLAFDYYDDGNLLRITQSGGTDAGGDFLADRSFVFTYTDSNGDAPAIAAAADRVDPDPATHAQSSRIWSVRDPRGNETRFTYYTANDNAKLRWKLATRSNRSGDVTSYVYDYLNQKTTVKAPLGRDTTYTYDTDGKITKLVDPNGQSTTVAWTGDFKVSRLTEPTGKYTSYTYNANGYPTSQTNQLGETTKLTYLDQPVDAADAAGHLSLLKTRTTPKGVATDTPTDDYQWSFTYDSAGNPDKVTDPTGATFDYDYSLPGSPDPGTLTREKDANGNVTTFPSYHRSGQPTEIVDAEGGHTRFGYDADGQLRWVQDPVHQDDSGDDVRAYRTYFDYDAFHRLGRQSAPKSTRAERGTLLWSSVDYDRNDNITRNVDPHYGGVNDDDGSGTAGSSTYDAMDRPLVVANSDTSVDPEGERTRYSWDAAGRLTGSTDPKGVLSGADGDHLTSYDYDLLDRVVRQTRSGSDSTQKRVTNLCYDQAGDLRSVTSPRSGLASVSCPATGVDFTARYDYDAAHRQVSMRDPLGHEKRVGYDANGNVTSLESDIDKGAGRSSHETRAYDQRDQLVTSEQTIGGGTGRKAVTRYEYDPNGNRKRIVSPRGVDAAHGSSTYDYYVTALAYDGLNRLTRVTLPRDERDKDASGAAESQYIHRSYDANGNLTMTSLPVTTASAGSVTAEAKTRMTYFDTGWVRTSNDPSNPEVHFDYAAQGWQTERVPERKGAAGELDTDRRMTWSFFADGQLRERKDQGGEPSTYTYDANNNLVSALDAAGVTDPGEKAMQTESTWTGFDEVDKVRHRKQGADTWKFTDYRYDDNGNVTLRRENGEEDTASPANQTKAPERHELSYDQADWLTEQLDLGNDSGCKDDQRVVNAFWDNGLEKQRDIYRAGAGCSSDPGSWPKKQTTSWTHFDNGKLKTLVTKAHRDGSDVTTESHEVSYVDEDGDWANNNRTVDTFFRERSNGDAGACGTAASACTEKIWYDARDKVIKHQRRDNVVDSFTLDEPAQLSDPTLRPGQVTTEVKDGTTTTRRYDGTQLTSMTVGGATGKFWYDALGNLDCVTAGGSGCGGGGLVVDYAYDYLNRMASSRSFDGAGGQTARTDYTYDALDRVDKEVEDHGGTGNDRTTTFEHQGLTNLVTQEKQSGGDNPLTKTFSYDAYGHRLAMTSTDASGTQNTYTYGYDVHGSVSQLIGDGGKVKASYGYDTYGGTDSTMTTGDVTQDDPLNPYRYSGKRSDAGMGTYSGGAGYDMGARRYGPDSTRFLQQDMYNNALGDLGLSLDPLTANRYSLAGGNPISYVEVDGHMLVADGGGGGSTTPNPTSSPSPTASPGPAPSPTPAPGPIPYPVGTGGDGVDFGKVVRQVQDAASAVSDYVAGPLMAASATVGKLGTQASALLREGASKGGQLMSELARKPWLRDAGRWARSPVGKFTGRGLGVAGAGLSLLGHRAEGDSWAAAGAKTGVEAGFAAAGSAVGASVGATIGSAVPVVGTIAGGAVGSFVGGAVGAWAGSALMDSSVGDMVGDAADSVASGIKDLFS